MNEKKSKRGGLLAKQAGRYKGCQTEYAPDSKGPQKRLIYQTVVERLKQGDTVAEIAKEHGLSRSIVYKIKKANSL
ncbi:hypothetical protein A5810_003236 [Enterococcus faecium]|uniref:Resolvase HTH domain-containing protein n=1 Tax=Enterococcus faecium TaxID=1352 RepID=A0A242AMF4_ENTFC|nr:hypothetical protein A5810_003236 [Enterococcus faecium]